MQATGKRIDLGNSEEGIYLTSEQILYVKADGNYCDIYLSDGDVMKTLGQQRAQIARKLDTYLPLEDKVKFALVGKSYIVNLDYVMRVHPSKQMLTFKVNEFGTCNKQCVHASVKALKGLIDMIKLYDSIKDYATDVLERAIRELESEKQKQQPPHEGYSSASSLRIGMPKGIDGHAIIPADYGSMDDDSTQLIGVNVNSEELLDKIVCQMLDL